MRPRSCACRDDRLSPIPERPDAVQHDRRRPRHRQQGGLVRNIRDEHLMHIELLLRCGQCTGRGTYPTQLTFFSGLIYDGLKACFLSSYSRLLEARTALVERRACISAVLAQSAVRSWSCPGPAQRVPRDTKNACCSLDARMGIASLRQ